MYLKAKRMTPVDLLSVIFAAVVPLGVAGILTNRILLKKGIGTQVIRLTALIVGLPMAAALALQGLMTEAFVSVLLGTLSYVFPGSQGES